MAKRRRKKHKIVVQKSPKREIKSFTNKKLLRRIVRQQRIEKRNRFQHLKDIQDARSFAKKTDRTIKGRPARVVHRVQVKYNPIYRYSYAVNRLRYVNPENAITCIRRKVRRQVLFANKLTKKGSGGAKKWTEKSFIRC